MSTKDTNLSPATANISVGQLGALLKGQKAASAPAQEKKPVTTEAPTEQVLGDEDAPAGDKVELEPGAEGAGEEGGEGEGEAADLLDGEGDAEGDGEGEGDAVEGEPKAAKGIKKLQKRVHQITAKNKDLERQLAEAKEKLASGGTDKPAAAPVGQGRFAHDKRLNDINAGLQEAEAALAWADENPEGAELLGDNGKTITYTAAQMKQIRRNAEAQRIQLSSDRSTRTAALEGEFNQLRSQAHTQAVKAYPWMKDDKSPEFQDAVEVLRMMPGLRDMADAPLAIGDYVRGMRLRLAEEKKPAAKTVGAPMVKPKGPPTATPVVAGATAAAPKINAKQKGAQDADTQFKSTGKVSDLAKMLSSKAQARQAA